LNRADFPLAIDRLLDAFMILLMILGLSAAICATHWAARAPNGHGV
jgi:hypothetical protein